MPTVIVPAPCAPPECNLAPRDVEAFVDALAAYYAAFAEAFRRPEQLRWSAVYLQGLLGPQARKTTERIALTQGVSVRDLQGVSTTSEQNLALSTFFTKPHDNRVHQNAKCQDFVASWIGTATGGSRARSSHALGQQLPVSHTLDGVLMPKTDG